MRKTSFEIVEIISRDEYLDIKDNSYNNYGGIFNGRFITY